MLEAVEDLNDIVAVAASAQDIKQATLDLDQLALACVLDDSNRPREALRLRWVQTDAALSRLRGLVLSRSGQAAMLALERLIQALREETSIVLSLEAQHKQVQFTKHIEGVSRIARYVASECDTLVTDDLSYFSQVQVTIRRRTTQTALTIILSVAVVLVLSLIGQAVVFSARIREIRDNDAQKERLLGALSAKGKDLERQIEERTRVELALRQSEAHITSLFDSIRDAVVATDDRGAITRLNPVAREWIGELDRGNTVVSVHDALQLSLRAHPGEKSEIVREVLSTGIPYISASPFTLVRDNRPDLAVSASISPLRSEAGKLIGCVIVLRDVSEALAIQERTEHAARMQAIGQLAGGVAHDFNNLLTGIVGYAELLQHSVPPHSEQSDLTLQIQRISTRAAELVRRLLDFARRGQIQREGVNVHTIIEEVVALLSHSVDKRIRLVHKLEASKPWVTGDTTQLQNAILNLCLNARDAMPDGGELSINTRNEQNGGTSCILLQVSDTGHGIAPELLGRIFEPFFTTKEQGKGTGLGLASVYGCVQSHQGDIHVESAPGRGSIFSVRLPVTEAGNAVHNSVSGKQERIPLRGLALVVDDEEMVRTVAQRHLVRLGFKVLATGYVHEALAWVKEQSGQIALVLLDVTMPQMSGTEVFRSIRDLDARIPILLVSGYTANPEVQDLLQTGPSRFLAKPFRFEELHGEIQLLLGKGWCSESAASDT
jgi:signal transduction histidine kinase/CheY-like chemotaxis protein